MKKPPRRTATGDKQRPEWGGKTARPGSATVWRQAGDAPPAKAAAPAVQRAQRRPELNPRAFQPAGAEPWLMVWEAWLQQPAGTALDKWLRFALPKLVPSPSAHGAIVARIHKAVVYQQLVCALEYAFQSGKTTTEWSGWDKHWTPKAVEKIPARVFAQWLDLRLGQARPDSDGAAAARQRVFAGLAARCETDPALQYLWAGMRPQWRAALKARAKASGWSADQLAHFVALQAVQPPLWLRAAVNADLAALTQQLSQQGVLAELTADGIALHGGRGVAGTALYKSGQIEIQDLASQQIAAAVAVQPGQKVWDVCAGAGGKALAIAGALNNKGVVVATDLHDYKLQEMKRRAKRAEIFNLRSFVWDAQAPLKLPKEVAQQQGFDWLLIDAPCSSTGTWRRNPDARWRFSDSDTESLVQLQRRILRQALPALRAGGRLVYATCSWDVRENEQQLAWLLDQYPELKLISQQLLGCPLQDSDTMFVGVLEKPPA